MKINTDPQKIEELLSRGVEEVIDRADLEKKLKSGQQLRIKLGIDPTSPNIHIGRSIPLLKLRDFQELGHQIVFIIGDFTGIIGDTSDKTSERPMLDEATIKTNIKKYEAQAAKILDMKKCEVCYNSAWLSKLKYKEIGFQANAFSINEFISRDNIRRRLDEGKRVSLREVLYPLMQGYDSVAIKADVELGGTDQRFNLLAGRELQRHYNQEPQNIITNPLVEGLDGRKMSSSWGNTVNLFDEPKEMFGKIMSLQDEFIIKYFTLVTRLDLAEVALFQEALKAGANPRDYKIKLAKELVKIYHNAQAADEAEEYFIKAFSKKEIPDDIPEVKIGAASATLFDILKKCLVGTSNGDIRRLVGQGAVKIDDQVYKNLDENIEMAATSLNFKVGKRQWFKVIR